MKQNRRRLLGWTLALLAAPRIGSAQARPVRIGVLSTRHRSPVVAGILKRLAELGYAEGKNMVLEYRSPDGVAERHGPLALELIRAKCDLILAVGSVQSGKAFIDAKANVPIVLVAVDYDPVKEGIVSSLRRPGGNVTGMFMLSPPLAAKRLELLREIVPNAKRFLVLSDHFTEDQLAFVRRAADQMRVDIVVERFRAPPYDFDAVFANGRTAGVEAVILLASPVLVDQRIDIAALAMKHGLPASGPGAVYSEAGFLFSYGAKTGTFVRAADIAASILKGAKPGEIPVEQPTEFEFVVNLKSAKALGIPIPPSILLRADRVIE